MNRGLASAQNSLEVSLVRQQLDAQADILRYVRDSAKAADKLMWQGIRSSGSLVSQANLQTTEKLLTNGCPEAFPPGAFVLAISSSGAIEKLSQPQQYKPASMYSGVMKNASNVSTAYGLWVQPVAAAKSAGSPDAYDMHIRACWYSAGNDRPTTLATIVRLYGT
ncbi:MAG TPA: hypothetical protein PKD19_02650 [Candidatus Saccharibacteria bacterium]|nr:hypothetical protein [Candidatus Saccharibacteria bacterium]